MRRTLSAGLSIALATVILVLVGGALDLKVDAAALTGAAMGAVVALVPDRSIAARLGGFAVGFLAAWGGYLVRAGLLPDTTMGRALTAGLVLLVAVAVCAATAGRLPLWSALVGAATMAGTYEAAYSAAPSLVADTSVTGATTALCAAAVGFLAAAAFAPTPVEPAAPVRREAGGVGDDASTALDSILEEAR